MSEREPEEKAAPPQTHTPGPWKWEFEIRDLGFVNPPSSPVLRGSDGKAIIDGFAFHEDGGIRSEYPEEIAEANARLIAAATELPHQCDDPECHGGKLYQQHCLEIMRLGEVEAVNKELLEALEALLDTCFVERPLPGGKSQWCIKTHDGWPMGMGSKHEAAVKRAAIAKARGRQL